MVVAATALDSECMGRNNAANDALSLFSNTDFIVPLAGDALTEGITTLGLARMLVETSD